MDKPSYGFQRTYFDAGRHLSMKGDNNLNWIRSDIHQPMVEHLAFRIGNQLFFIFKGQKRPAVTNLMNCG